MKNNLGIEEFEYGKIYQEGDIIHFQNFGHDVYAKAMKSETCGGCVFVNWCVNDTVITCSSFNRQDDKNITFFECNEKGELL